MVIGRSEDRENPWDRLVLRHHCSVWNPIRVTHLGQRSTDRTAKAGHMTATDQTVAAAQPLQAGGRPHMRSRRVARREARRKDAPVLAKAPYRRGRRHWTDH